MAIFEYLPSALYGVLNRISNTTQGNQHALQTKQDVPKSHISPLCHPRVELVTQEVDGYFLEHWPFPNDKARKKFVNAGFSRVTCLYFPKALDDRIHFACRLLTVLFLIDGESNSTGLP
jgi:aristolochene synthase